MGKGTKGHAAPAPGVYAGTIGARLDGGAGTYARSTGTLPAVFAVTGDAVYATYFMDTQDGAKVVLQQGAWDVVDGRFHPTVKGGPARCSIRLKSRTCERARVRA